MNTASGNEESDFYLSVQGQRAFTLMSDLQSDGSQNQKTDGTTNMVLGLRGDTGIPVYNKLNLTCS